jgi:hypothetical protein
VGTGGPMHLCACVSEEGGDGEDVVSQEPNRRHIYECRCDEKLKNKVLKKFPEFFVVSEFCLLCCFWNCCSLLI